jgi:hypothetical protein
MAFCCRPRTGRSYIIFFSGTTTTYAMSGLASLAPSPPVESTSQRSPAASSGNASCSPLARFGLSLLFVSVNHSVVPMLFSSNFLISHRGCILKMTCGDTSPGQIFNNAVLPSYRRWDYSVYQTREQAARNWVEPASWRFKCRGTRSTLITSRPRLLLVSGRG